MQVKLQKRNLKESAEFVAQRVIKLQTAGITILIKTSAQNGIRILIRERPIQTQQIMLIIPIRIQVRRIIIIIIIMVTILQQMFPQLRNTVITVEKIIIQRITVLRN
jgi:hypothetical protein